MAKIVVIGSANVDVIAPAQRLPRPGETMSVGEITLCRGGKGANAAVAAARLGADVKFVGCVGNDPFGNSIRIALLHEGIDCEYLSIAECPTGTAVILLDPASGQNSILIGSGANRCISLPKDDRVFHWADLVMLQLETPLAINVEAARRAKAAGAMVVLDPAPATSCLPDELLASVDLISPNETELATLTDCPTASLDEIASAARTLLDRRVRQVVVKLGERGAMLITPEVRAEFDAIPVNVVDTTAAGDAFTAALSVAIADNVDIRSAIERGCVCGALACTQLGAQPSLPTKQQQRAKMLELKKSGAQCAG